MKQICDSVKCTGCGTCYVVCPRNCITMIPDEFGFYRPQINKIQCISCNICQNKCPQNKEEKKQSPIEVYAAWNKNPNERESSSSGGIAAGFYQYALNNKYYICGTKFVDGLQLSHVITNYPEDRKDFKGSKYVQSRAYLIFGEIRDLLKKGNKVLFVGTPCQVAGLLNVVGRNHQNLITVDLICHGVPSEKYLKEHIKSIVGSNLEQVEVSFRDKLGWYLDIKRKGKSLYRNQAYQDFYYEGFLNAVFYRESCYDCQYACTERVGDITIGDFWGLGKLEPVKYPIEKVSLVLINTQKGKWFWNEASDLFISEKRSIDEARIDNGQLIHSSLHSPFSAKFKRLYRKMGFENAVKKCLWKTVLKYKIKNFFQKIKYKMNRKVPV